MKNFIKSKLQNNRARVFLLILFFAFAAGISQLIAGELKIQLPPETASFKPTPGSQLANAQCMTCHSGEYVQTQPPFSQTFWLAEVKKMRDKFGAPIPEDQIESLAYYFTKNYGISNTISSATNSSSVLTNSPSVSVEALATKYGCLTCHKVEVKVVGPAFRDIATKYRNDPVALQKIYHQIHYGGAGQWGPVAMPAFPFVSDAEAQRLAHWIMSPNTNAK
jgi:cytochrome c551/c552